MKIPVHAIAFTCLSACLANRPCCAQIYQGQTANGATFLTNIPSQDPLNVVVAADVGVTRQQASKPAPGQRNDTTAGSYAGILHDVGKKYRIDPMLLDAIIRVESGYDPHAVSLAGASGLMQIMPATAQRFGAGNLLDPEENIRTGARYLSWLLRRFKGDLKLALAGYNAGEGAVIQAGYRIPVFPETLSFVPKVLGIYRAGAPQHADQLIRSARRLDDTWPPI